MTKGFRKMSWTLLASAALATAGLLPASANAQVWYSPACIEYFTNYCAANWQALGFASSAQCAEHYKETVCKGYTAEPLRRRGSSGAAPTTGSLNKSRWRHDNAAEVNEFISSSERKAGNFRSRATNWTISDPMLVVPAP